MKASELIARLTEVVDGIEDPRVYMRSYPWDGASHPVTDVDWDGYVIILNETPR